MPCRQCGGTKRVAVTLAPSVARRGRRSGDRYDVLPGSAMPVASDVERKLEVLRGEAAGVMSVARQSADNFADEGDAQRCASKAAALLTSVFGKDSHFVEDVRRLPSHETWHESQVKQLWGIIAAAHDAWCNGYVFDLRAEAEAEVEGGLLSSATRDLAAALGVDAPERRAAAVLAGSVRLGVH